MNEKNKIVADSGNTITFSRVGEKETPHEVLMKVYYSMREKGYDPVSQIVGYLISGDPTYITSYNNARYLIRMFERDELIEELVRTYVEQYNGDDTLRFIMNSAEQESMFQSFVSVRSQWGRFSGI